MGRGGGEAPQRDVLEGRLPAGQQGGRDVPGRGGPVELGEAAACGRCRRRRPAGRPPRRAGVGVVQRSDGAAELGGEARAGWELGEVEVVAGQVGVDGGAAALLRARRTPWASARRRAAGGRAARAGRPCGPSRRRRPRCAAPASPSGGAGCPGRRRRRRAGRRFARQRLDARRVEARYGGAGQGGEEEGAAVHAPTVCRATRPRVAPVGRTARNLANLALARTAVDRAADRRADPQLLPSLLADRATRVLRGGRRLRGGVPPREPRWRPRPGAARPAAVGLGRPRRLPRRGR